MSLRLRLVLLSLVTLVLPWAGCEYAREMEAVLRKGQEDALLTTARILQSVLATDSALLEESFGFEQQPEGPRVFAPQLLTDPILDGFPDEWPPIVGSVPRDDSSLRLGVRNAALYAYLHVVDEHVTYESPQARVRAGAPNYDRVLLLTRDTTGIERAWSISAVAPGPIVVRQCDTQAPWLPTTTQSDEIRGVWRATADGYDIELRIPRRLVGAQFAMSALKSDIASSEFLTPQLRTLHTASEELTERMMRFAPDGVRIAIVDSQGWLLARGGSIVRSQQTEPAPDDDDISSFYRWVLARDEQTTPAFGLPYGMWGDPVDAARNGESSAIWFASDNYEPAIVRASVPITRDGRVIGALTVEQAGELWLRERNDALSGLFTIALLATFGALLATLAFAVWISRRIRRLSIAANTALSPEGRIERRLPEMQAHDELGDLARNFASLLQRIDEYAAYLQTLGSKLSHEFRTPLAIVSSSLDNLTGDTTDPLAQAQFISRARDGAARLRTILSAMTEATRVEQSIEHAEQVPFDLADLVRRAGQAYQQTFATHRIDVTAPQEPCRLHGSPDLVAQMLDKLIDNAVDFCPRGGRIGIELTADPKHYRLSVHNEGPTLPPDAQQKIFDMLVSQRGTASDKPHLGLGLFIVQLIARAHRGVVSAHNLADGSGVAFEIAFARN